MTTSIIPVAPIDNISGILSEELLVYPEINEIFANFCKDKLQNAFIETKNLETMDDFYEAKRLETIKLTYEEIDKDYIEGNEIDWELVQNGMIIDIADKVVLLQNNTKSEEVESFEFKEITFSALYEDGDVWEELGVLYYVDDCIIEKYGQGLV